MAYGTVNADVVQSSVSGVSLGAGNASIMKNRIINGAMNLDQYNAGASKGTTTLYSNMAIDRWFASYSQTSKFTTQQNAGSVTPPAGFANYLGITSSAATSLGASDYFQIGQAIEGVNTYDLAWGTANAKTITISAWVYSSLTGTFGGAVKNAAGNRSYAFTYSIPVANTWTQISVTIAGDTTGTWVGATNGAGLTILFGLGSGPTYSGTAGVWTAGNLNTATGAVSVVGTNGATWYVTGVQLEVGSVATGFEYRMYTTEVQLCQRYYTTGRADTRGGLNASNQIGYQYQFYVQMRTTPTITITTTSGTPNQAYQTPNSFLFYGTTGSTENSATWVATAEL